MLMKKSVTDFLAELKSNSPAPGGGSVAALAGALAAALGVMVGNLTLGSAKCADAHDEAGTLKCDLEKALTRLASYVDEDTAAFNEVMAAYKLPKDSDEDKAIRGQAIQAALQKAAKLPLEVAATCVGVLELSHRMLAIGNPNAASDAAVAGRLAHAGVWAALYNVRINLASIKESSFLETAGAEVRALAQKADAALAALSQKAEEVI
ncbi:cyclodeaminase/cyclohydrolase family protein [Azotosporobacter soli]|uniref:cyclodeaminase/cyclohydrolase family protein n=1 Tax=Azotosporobacter soli TaxID=3055040 RepID=UPI0031FECB07